MAETTHRPFHCGTQYADWSDANCGRCTKGADRDNPPARCPCDIEQALLEACFGDGSVSLPIAERMGSLEANEPGQAPRYCWPCKEWEPTEAWKAEYTARNQREATNG
jgi:hypothetical protein